MLVLTRKKDQAIIIGDKIEITVLDVRGDQVRIGINAPGDVTILRREVYQEVREENRTAVKTVGQDLNNLAKIIKNERNSTENG